MSPTQVAPSLRIFLLVLVSTPTRTNESTEKNEMRPKRQKRNLGNDHGTVWHPCAKPFFRDRGTCTRSWLDENAKHSPQQTKSFPKSTPLGGGDWLLGWGRSWSLKTRAKKTHATILLEGCREGLVVGLTHHPSQHFHRLFFKQIHLTPQAPGKTFGVEN